jgi:prepilin-type N-terminal cleavage/methylation domain-containing protein
MTRHPRGFTLVEVIVIITVIGLLGALVVNLMGTQLLRSSNPATIASNAGDAETAMEAVVANFTNKVNSNITTALDTLKADYASNSTVSIVDTPSWNGVRALIVTTTVGNTSYTTLLTQERTNDLDHPTNF